MKNVWSVLSDTGEGVPVCGFGAGTLSHLWAPPVPGQADLPEDLALPGAGSQEWAGALRQGWPPI